MILNIDLSSKLKVLVPKSANLLTCFNCNIHKMLLITL